MRIFSQINVLRKNITEHSILFVTTNDAWFGEEGCAEQHASHSVLRSLETGVPVLRCGNAGWSGWISPSGVVQETLLNEEDSVYFQGASVLNIDFGPNKETIYHKYGNFFVALCAFFSHYGFFFIEGKTQLKCQLIVIMSQINYDFLIKQIQRDLPTLPTIVNELTTILENPNSSTMVVEDIVTADQCMAAKILRVANTSFFRAGGDRVKDVNQAIGNVGFEKVKDVVLNNSVFKLFKNDNEDRFSLTGLWKHSLGVASIAREIAKFLGKSWHETAYTCGLVHDIGKVARYKLDEIDNTEFFSRIRFSQSENRSVSSTPNW